MQVPASFEYERAATVEEALALLARHGPEARVVAGGHSLIPMMKLRLAEPEALVDINDVAELSRIGIEGDTLRVGAMVRHAELLDSAAAGEHFPILHDAERVIADPVVRNRGTVGGSLCQADPSEDLSAAFGALRALAVIRGPDGERTVPIREFHTGPYETVVEPGELLTELRVPIRPGGSSAYEKVERSRGLAARRRRGRAAAGRRRADRRGRDRAHGGPRRAFRRRRGRGRAARRRAVAGAVPRSRAGGRRELRPRVRPARPGRLQAASGR
ncbi:hypothetical protein GCM10010191_78980 [Actinomadura vinacea]|uniref:FAD-binding PCMH-type domain-containing protein n=1 Tax=Actinomadura vinacea TaxID=115336 RepID=A0ABP5XCN2_9ACTN